MRFTLPEAGNIQMISQSDGCLVIHTMLRISLINETFHHISHPDVIEATANQMAVRLVLEV